MISSSVSRWTKLALVAWQSRFFSTLIGLEQFDVIGRAMRDGKAPFGLYTVRFGVSVTLLVKTIESPPIWLGIEALRGTCTTVVALLVILGYAGRLRPYQTVCWKFVFHCE